MVGVHEEAIQSLKCPMDARGTLARYASELTQVIGDNLTGIYLYGSIARGCYHPVTSDIDVIAITKTDITESARNTVLRVHQEAQFVIDAVYVTASQIRADVVPTPVSFLVKPACFKPVSDWRIVQPAEGRIDFLLQRQDVYEAGVTVAGASSSEIVPPVPWDLLAKSLDLLFPHIVPMFKNPALMLCRIAYAHTHRRLCGKRQAGEWGAVAFGESWEPIIRMALAEYAGGCARTDIPSETIRAFEEHCAGYVNRLRTEQ